MRNHRHVAILIAIALVSAGCNSNNAADTPGVEETTTPPESTETTVEVEEPVVDDPSVLNGSYQLEWDSDELWEALGDPQTEEVNAESGVVVITFDNGRLEAAWHTGPSAGNRDVATYEVSGDRITMVIGGDLVEAAWELTDSQLILSDFKTYEPFFAVYLGTKPLTRLDGPASAADTDTGWTHHLGDAARSGVADAGPSGKPIELWRFQAEAPCNQPPIVVGQTALVACEDGNVYALNVADGSESWRFESGQSFGGGLAAAGGLVYAADDAGTLYVIEIATGDEIWRLGSEVVTSSAVKHRLVTGPAVEDGLVTVGTGDGALIGVDAATGVERWRYEITGAGELRNPAMADGLVYIGSTAAGLTAVDAETGELAWQADTGGPTATVRVIEGIAYVGSSGGQGSATPLSAFDAETGDLLWQREPLFPPTVLNGVGYSGSLDSGAHAFDTSDGSEIWQAGLTGHGRSIQAPVIAGDIVYFFSEGDGAVYALDAATGDELWQLEVDANFTQVVVADKRLYIVTSLFIGTELGEVVAIGGSAD